MGDNITDLAVGLNPNQIVSPDKADDLTNLLVDQKPGSLQIPAEAKISFGGLLDYLSEDPDRLKTVTTKAGATSLAKDILTSNIHSIQTQLAEINQKIKSDMPAEEIEKLRRVAEHLGIYLSSLENDILRTKYNDTVSEAKLTSTAMTLDQVALSKNVNDGPLGLSTIVAELGGFHAYVERLEAGNLVKHEKAQQMLEGPGKNNWQAADELRRIAKLLTPPPPKTK